jgi:tetratricopeptide (TPR) repeat protein
MFAKMALPLLGGAPAVWNVCLVFYQAALLGGYLYSHFTLRWLGPRRQALLHLFVLCLPWFVLPLGIDRNWNLRSDAFQAFSLWGLLSVTVGLPFLVVSASAPMLQAWFADTDAPSARDPYFLYAASNLGSMLALLSYPVLFEPTMTLASQSHWWAWVYGILMALIAGCAIRLWRSRQHVRSPEDTSLSRPSPRQRLHWIVLAFVPSSLLLGVTSHITSDIAPMPLLWVIPLALYLLSFVLVFARRSFLPIRWMTWTAPYLLVAAVASLFWSGDSSAEIILLRTLHLVTFFVVAMVCHGRIAAERPEASQLTEYYLLMSLGGVLGGLFNSLIAPLVFSTLLEYPLMLAAAGALLPATIGLPPGRIVRTLALPAMFLLLAAIGAWLIRSGGSISGSHYADSPLTSLLLVTLAVIAAVLVRRRPVYFAIGVLGVSFVSLRCASVNKGVIHIDRSFFGVLRVTYDPLPNARILAHGSTQHGMQGLDPLDRHEPWGYYHPHGPLGDVFRALQGGGGLREVGILGLGTGSIAAYGQPGQHFTYYEIDSAVERIARNYFTYLADSPATVEVVIGDARLSLVRESNRRFDLLIVDVFNSDSVPVHLLTREALEVYKSRLTPHGVLAFHISCRYFDLAQVLSNLAADAGLTALMSNDRVGQCVFGEVPSDWVVMSRQKQDLRSLVADPRWSELKPRGGRLWTDDYSNILAVVAWHFDWKSFWSANWWRDQRVAKHAAFAQSLADLGRIDRAAEHFLKALEIEPKNSDLHASFAVVLARNNRTSEAIEQFQKAVEFSPENAELRHNLGLALMSCKRPGDALIQFRKAIDIDPNFADAHGMAGIALLSLRQINDALVEFDKALAIDPSLNYARQAIEQIRRGTAATSAAQQGPLPQKAPTQSNRN